jgi:diguanylate cyclase (GGDEF)-like protein/PAS domain S-box-containing protein
MDMHMPAGRIDPGPGLEDSVRAEQLALLTTNRADQYVNILTAVIVVAIVHNLYPAWLLSLWLFLCIAVVLARSLTVAHYKTRPESHRRFAQLILATTIAIGCLWGLAASAILLTNNPATQFFLMIMLGGMMAGGVMGNAASLPAMYGFALPIILPSVFAFATRGTDMHLLGLLQALYAGIVLNAGRKFNHVITDNIRLRLGESGLLEKLRTSESAMTISQKIAHIGTWEYDVNTGGGFFSPEAYNIFGVRPGAFRPSFESALTRVHPDDQAIVIRHQKLHRTAALSPGLEVRLVMDDGTIKYVHEIRRTIFDSDGRATRIIGSIQDVSVRRAAEAKLQFANLLLQTQMEASPDGIMVANASRHIVSFNHRFAAMWRLTLAELEAGDDNLIRAKIIEQVKDPEAYAARAAFLANHPETAGHDEIETLDGRIIERHSVALQPVTGGPSLGRVRFYRDISLRRAAQKAQEYANLLLRTQMEARPDGILVVDANRRMTSFNQMFAEMWRIPPADMRPGNDDAIRALMRAQIRDPGAYVANVEDLYANPDLPQNNEIETVDGRTIERYGNALISASGEHLGHIRFYRDISLRRAAEQKLQFANLLLSTQMEASPDGILVVDANRHIISSNARFAEIWRLAEADVQAGNDVSLRAQMAAQTVSPAAYNDRINFLASHPEQIVHDEVEMADGRTLERYTRTLLAPGGALLGRIWFYKDISLRRTAEQKLQFANLLLQTQMEASPDGILVVDPDQNIIAFSRRLAEIWQIPLTELENNEYDKGLAKIVSSIKDPAAFMARIAYLGAHPDEIGDDEIETVDGRIIERHGVPLRTGAGGHLGRAWFFSDVTAIRQSAAALAYRDRMLHAVTAATSVAVRAVSLDTGVPTALGQIGEIMKVDRVAVVQLMPEDTPPLGLRYLWEAPFVTVPFDLADTARFDAAEMAAWRAPLRNGIPVFADSRSAQGAVRDLLAHYQLKSICHVPVHVAGQVWGFISVDDGRANRQWTASENETLGILADIAGALVTRERARVALAASEDLFRRLTDIANDAVILSGPAGEIVQWNPAAERIFGYSAAEAIGQQAIPLIVLPQDRERVRLAVAAAAADLSMTIEFTLMRKNGSGIETEMSVSAMPFPAGQGILNVLRDITARKAAEARLQFANIMMNTQMEASPDGILAIDAAGRIISFNRRFAELWRVPPALLLAGDDAPVLAHVTSQTKDPQAFAARVRHLYANPGEIGDDEIETADGRLFERHSRTLQSATEANLGRVWFFRDISLRRAAEALALRHARFDDLTGLANRAVFVEAVDAAIAQTNRGGPGFAVLFLDLDHFKDVNDTLGHPAGDDLLRQVAARLLANIRETDTAGRFGGDEFAIAATTIHDPADAALLGEKLIAAIAAPYLVAGNTIHIEASIGIDIFSPAADNAETLLSHADVALYRAKAEGRGMYRFFTASMDRDVHKRVKLGAELREAIAGGKLFLLYQPQVAAATGRITGVEALVRWNHPERGILTPASFIPVAEATGQIAALGHFVLWEACRQAREWIDAGLPPTRVSVNVSALQFKTALLLEADIAAALHTTGLPPHLLELELTETVLMDASRDHKDTLRRLRERGVKISIDDFGTGYSSLDYLRRFPVDHIKIAQSFVRNVETEPGDASIVRAIIGLARTLRIKLIVEGVATRSQLDLLQSWGCTEVQGYFFSRPVSPAQMFELLKAGPIIP